MAQEIRGLDVPAVTAWLARHVEGADGGLSFELVAAGGSNLTYRVTSANGARWALRRPPVAARVATAHDMSREWRILSALHAHPEAGIPVPAAVAYCDDPDVIGADFYVMGFADGRILRGPDEAADMTAEQCLAATESLVDVQIAMHTIDAEAAGLGDLGRPDAYVERQLRRWLRQYEHVETRELPLVRALHARLSKSIPPQQGTGLVHGDYRFDNTVLGDDFRILAVLDWELCTLGDPVADFAWSIEFWSEPGDERDFGSRSPTRHEAFPRRDEVVAMYAERSGFDLSGLDYYRAFTFWKMACLVEGAVARIRAGASGGMGRQGDPRETEQRVEWLLEQAAEAATGL